MCPGCPAFAEVMTEMGLDYSNYTKCRYYETVENMFIYCHDCSAYLLS
jgi:hypothetical protein